jgi:hypothetical protein
MRKLILALVLSFSSLLFAQSPPQIPLTGNIGVAGSVAILGGVTLQIPSDADYTLTAAQWANKTLIITSAVDLTARRNLIAPLNKGQEYNVENNTSGGQSIQVIGASGTGVTIPNGASASVFSDGTNYIQVSGGATFAVSSSGTSGAATLSDGTLNIPRYDAGNFSASQITSGTLAPGRLGLPLSAPLIGTDASGNPILVSGVNPYCAGVLCASQVNYEFTPNAAPAVTVAMGSSDTTITVASTTGFPSKGCGLIVGNSPDIPEAVCWSGTTATTFTGVTRAVYGTAAVAHSTTSTLRGMISTVAATINSIPFSVFYNNGVQTYGGTTYQGSGPVVFGQFVQFADSITVSGTTNLHAVRMTDGASGLQGTWSGITGLLAATQLNDTFYVDVNGLSTYRTIQSAVTAACAASNARVFIPAGVTPTDTIADVIGGCNTVGIEDQRETPNKFYTWTGSVYTETSSGAGVITAAQVLTSLRANNTYMGCEGDSRIAIGLNGGSGQDICSRVALQSNFSGLVGHVDLAVSGSTCSAMTSRYATGMHNYRPGGSAVPASVTNSILLLEIGVNDLRVGVSALAEEACVQSYIATAVADGFTVIPMTVYWYGGYTDAQAAQSNAFNDWLRNIPHSGMFPDAQVPFVFDFDLYFPPESASPYFYVAGTPFSITAESVSSGVLSVTTTTQSLTANAQAYLSGFPVGTASACLNGQSVIVSATGLSATTFQAPVGCADFAASAIGTGQPQTAVTTAPGLHMGPNGNSVAAQAFNQAYGLAANGSSSVLQPNFRDYYQPPSGQFRINGCLKAGGPGASSCDVPGAIYATNISDATQGVFHLGTGLIQNQGSGGWRILMPAGGGFSISGGTSGFTYDGGDITAKVAGASVTPTHNGILRSCTDSSCAGGFLRLGAGQIDYNSTATGKLSFNSPIYAKPTSGVGGGLDGAEGTAPTGNNNIDNLWADSTSHRWMMRNNNGSAQILASLSDLASSSSYGVVKLDGSTITASGGVISAGLPGTTTTIGTTAIAANTCTSTTTISVPGVTTSAAFYFTPISDISGVTGWGSSGGLVIVPWPTTNNLNYKVCNQTAASITPSASVTFNVGIR